MITLLLGSDDFSKMEYVNSELRTPGVDFEILNSEDSLPPVHIFIQQNLFSKTKTFLVLNLLAKLKVEQDLESLIVSKNHVVFVEEKLDKRLTATKQILSNKKIVVIEFVLPHGKGLNEWVQDRVHKMNGLMSPEVIALFVKKIGRDNAVETKFGGKVVEVKEVYTLWQVHNELLKLLAFAGEGAVTSEIVENLVNTEIETDVFNIVNSIAEGNKQETFKLIGNFLNSDNGTDEKSRIIQLNALLSEQFRNIVMVQSFLLENFQDQQILDRTSWKSGRLFMIKKISSRFNSKKAYDLLNKLASLDGELKTTNTPAKVLLDLIVFQLFS